MDGESMQSMGILDPVQDGMSDVQIDPQLTEGLGMDTYAAPQEAVIDDVDSDYEDLDKDIEKLNVSVRAFLASHHGVPQPPPPAPPQARGPTRSARKAAEPRGDIKARLFRANRAFMMGDLQAAKDLVFDVIRINAETHQAWTTLSSIFREEGHVDKALMSMVYAAHLKPKDAPGWLKCAEFALDVADEHPEVDLTTARMCYSAAVSADPKNTDARLGRALACHRLGHVSLAVADYNFVLARRPLDLDVIRKLAEACMDSKDVAAASGAAIQAYDALIRHTEAFPDSGDAAQIGWYDVGIYSELLACANRPRDAIFQLKVLSRRLLGRQQDGFWDQWQGDDREFDEDEARRLDVPEYYTLPHNHAAYGLGLPRDLRVRLAIYRLTADDVQEALSHLQCINPANAEIAAELPGFSFLIRDLSAHLFDHELMGEAQVYYEFLRTIPGEGDAEVLLQLGRCHLAKGDSAAAEESFLAAIDADADSIDARVELANLYSTAHEDEEALILVTEAMTLQQTRAAAARPDGGRTRKAPARPRGPSGKTASGVIPRRYRPKRLVDPVKRRQEEMERARRLSTQFVTVQDLKARIRAGDESVVPAWMAAAKELIDDFRAYRKFYSWDNYLKFLGTSSGGVQQADQPEGGQSSLDAIRQRLSKALMPQGADEQGGAGREPDFNEYQGISFGDWLDLFIDYAISLAAEGQYEEAYRVCEAAKDSTVFTVSEENTFFIYIAWGACAIYASDEETCVSIARQIMRDHVLSSDSFRLFSLLCRLCQSSVSWYSSGPAQKFILRQIKAMDATVISERGGQLDVSPLMLYGHILFTSTSYVYAIHYFLRALALDPTNPVITLSLGLGYIHYGLKRQSVNRQYLILQGLAFLLHHYRSLGPDRSDEANYGLGRTFQLLGLQSLALGSYARVGELPADPYAAGGTGGGRGDEGPRRDGERVVRLAAAYNSYVSYVMSNDLVAARDVVSRLVL